jgi:holo-[acyl-carrier protein] synthase
MKIRTGIDIVNIPRFKKSYINGGKSFSRLIFSEEESKDSRIEHLAGIFALKEALIKCSVINVGEMRMIEVKNDISGKPFVVILEDTTNNNKLSMDVSITHDGDYAVAVAVVVFNN